MRTSRRHGAMVGVCVGGVGLLGLAVVHVVAGDARELPGPGWALLLGAVIGGLEAAIDAWTRRPVRGARRTLLATLAAVVVTAFAWNAVAGVFVRTSTLLAAALGVGVALAIPLAHDAWALRRGPPASGVEAVVRVGWGVVLPALATTLALLVSLGIGWLDRAGAPLTPASTSWTFGVASVAAAVVVGAPLGLVLGLLRLVRPTDPAPSPARA